MHRKQSRVVTVAHGRMQHRHRLAVPGQPEIALVGGHDDVALAGPGHDLAQMFDAENAAGGVDGELTYTSAGRCGPRVREPAATTRVPASRAP